MFGTGRSVTASYYAEAKLVAITASGYQRMTKYRAKGTFSFTFTADWSDFIKSTTK